MPDENPEDTSPILCCDEGCHGKQLSVAATESPTSIITLSMTPGSHNGDAIHHDPVLFGLTRDSAVRLIDWLASLVALHDEARERDIE